jgi:hypothetical protein
MRSNRSLAVFGLRLASPTILKKTPCFGGYYFEKPGAALDSEIATHTKRFNYRETRNPTFISISTTNFISEFLFHRIE